MGVTLPVGDGGGLPQRSTVHTYIRYENEDVQALHGGNPLVMQVQAD